MTVNLKEYKGWLGEISKRYRQSQIKAAVAVNTEMLKFYFSLGPDIVRMENDRVIKCTGATGGQHVEVPLEVSDPQPLEQFVTGNILPGCGMKEAKALTHLMVMAYGRE